MIRIKNLSSGYGRSAVIKDTTVEADKGQLIALLGTNGCGKSTLLKTLVGILKPSGGSIEINGTVLQDKARGREVAYLSQERFAAPAMTVGDVVELGRVPHRGRLGRISDIGQAAIENAMQKTQITPFTDRLFSQLSGGEQARVLLARALAVDAPILLADEPIAALDPYYQLSMMEILKSEAAQGKLVIAAVHDLALASQYADIIWLMKEGRVASNGPPDTVLTDSNLMEIFNVKGPASGLQTLSLL